MCIAYTWDIHSTNDDRIRRASCRFTFLILLGIVVNVFLFLGVAALLAFLYYSLVIPGERTEIYRIVTNALRNRCAPPGN